MSQQKLHVVILGASFTGCSVGHKVLKSNPSIKVTLVNPSDYFYFNIAAPRVVAKPEIQLDKVLISVPEHFKQYSKANFEFIRGAATSVNFDTKSIQIDGGKDLSYDYIVIATGSTTPGTAGPESIPFKATNSNDLHEKLKDAQSRITKANTIIIAGAGPVGVETAAEIAEAYGDKNVTLISSHGQVLPDMKASAASAATANLEKLGVKIILSTKVTSSDVVSQTGKWSVGLNNGKTLDADLFISAAGNLPNTSFMDATLLDKDGWVKVDEHMRVIGAQDKNAFALGDVTTYKQRYLLKAQDQVAVVAANVTASISRQALKTYKANDKLMCFVPTGSKSGTGQIGGFVAFSFMVAFVKSKDFFIPKAASYISA